MIKGFRSISELDSLHSEQHRLLFRNCLGIIEKVFSTVPTADELPIGYLAFYESGSTRRLYANFNGTITYFIGAGEAGEETDLTGYMQYSETRFKVGTFTRGMDTASGDVEYTGIGFTPTAIIIMGAVGGTSIWSEGFSDGTTDESILDTHATTADSRGLGSNYLIYLAEDAAKFQNAVLKSFGDGKFTLTWTKGGTPTSQTATLYYIAFR